MKYRDFFKSTGYRSNIYKPLFCQGHHIGLVAKEVEQELIPYQDVFSVNSNQIDICPEISGFQEISDNIDRVLRSIRDKDLFQGKLHMHLYIIIFSIESVHF